MLAERRGIIYLLYKPAKCLISFFYAIPSRSPYIDTVGAPSLAKNKSKPPDQ